MRTNDNSLYSMDNYFDLSEEGKNTLQEILKDYKPMPLKQLRDKVPFLNKMEGYVDNNGFFQTRMIENELDAMGEDGLEIMAQIIFSVIYGYHKKFTQTIFVQ